MVFRPFHFLLIVLPFGLLCQELPPIQNYTPIEYGAGNQNWSFDQSDDKYIYAANNSGLVEYNGSSWRLYQSPNGTPMKSVKVIKDRVYTGSYMEFGFWKRDEFGILSYSSLIDNLQTPLIEDEHFWNISEYKNWVLFQSLDRLYIYNFIDDSFDIIEAKTTRAAILEVGNKIYFQKIGEGIFSIENGGAVLVTDDDIVRNDIVVGAYLIEEKLIIITEKGEFYFLDNRHLTKWIITGDKEVTTKKVYSTIRLHDGSFVLGTISNGAYHLDENGALIMHINQEKGLNNNTVLSLFQDIDKNLWLGLDNGISVVNLDSPFNEYIDHIGGLGVVYTAILWDNILYLGTNQGLFYKSKDNDTDFQLINGTQGQVWKLKEIDGTLFCGHHEGTFVIERNKAKKIADFPGTWDIHEIASNKNLLLQGNYKGLSILEKNNAQWTFRNKIIGFDSSSRFFEFINEQHILVNHEYKGVFDVKIDSGYTQVNDVVHIDSKGVGSSLVRFNDEIVYTTINGVFKYLNKQHDFVKDSLLTDKFFSGDDDIVGVLQTTNDSKKLWGFANNSINYISSGLLSDIPQISKISAPKFFRRSMGVLGFESIVHLENEVYLIGMANGFVTLDLNKVRQGKNEISINSISKEDYDAPSTNIKLKEFTEFKFKENSIDISYTVPVYDKYTEVYYQYRLNTKDSAWSNWSTTSEVSFKNLPYGTYDFKVRAKVGNETSSNIASYNFEINKPWYLSYLAIFCYIILCILLSALIHKLYKGYYKKQQTLLVKESRKRLKRKKLKNQKKIVQMKNEQLQELIENKNRELAISTMSIIKKNEFLNAIKDQLKEVVDNTKIKSVIRTIDRNINNEDDWKFFENAFNNADKDFLKILKNVHPELSANDLRLCAYLRLNLSSKEIAPLLNISVRSVEVKRYRLRKKMNLSHENGLTEYIMAL